MKNLLAENMRRFATKNLTEQLDGDANNNGYLDDTEQTAATNASTKMHAITMDQLAQLAKIRTELIKNYNEKQVVNYTTVRDIDNLIEELIRESSLYESKRII
jgi:hypothetical protein